MECAEAYVKGPIPNDTVKKIMDDVFALEAKEVQLKRSYGDKVGKVLPAWKVTRDIQIESKIRAFVTFELAKRIPLTYQPVHHNQYVRSEEFPFCHSTMAGHGDHADPFGVPQHQFLWNMC